MKIHLDLEDLPLICLFSPDVVEYGFQIGYRGLRVRV